MDNGRAAHDELLQFLRERDQQGFQTMVDFHGGVEGWFDVCRARRAVNPDYKVASIIVRVLRRANSAGPAVRLMMSPSLEN